MKNQNQIMSSCIKIFLWLIVFTGTSSAQSKTQWDAPSWADTLRNPYVHVKAITDTGKVIYQKTCSVCHGTSGKGDGIAAVGLMVKPANHTSPHVQQQSDGALFYKISNGHLPMPPFKNILTEKQRWALVNYIRTLCKVTPSVVKSKNHA